MDQQEAWLKAALEEAAPAVEETGVMQSVVRKGRSLRRRRRAYRTLGSLAVAAFVIGAGIGTFVLLERGQSNHMQFGSPQDSVAATIAGQGQTTTSGPGTVTSGSGATTPGQGTIVSGRDTTTSRPETTTTQAISSSGTVYKDVAYGFTFALPNSWRGFTIVDTRWEGFRNQTSGAATGNQPVRGPEILIRNPAWTAADPHQDIPILVFTLAQWKQVQQAELTVSAAPIPPTELGHNSTYVFALPARYNYAFPTGYEEVERILAGRPLQGFDPTASDYEITKKDIGQTFAFTVTTRFSVVLDGSSHPATDARVIPSGVVAAVSNVPAVAPPLQAAGFEALAPGVCTIDNGDFGVTVVVVDLSK